MNRWRKCGCSTQQGMCHKTTQTAVQFASIGRSRRGRCRTAEESQLCYFPRRPLERAACGRLHAAASHLAVPCDPRAFRSTFATATRPLLLLWISNSAHRRDASDDKSLRPPTTRTASGPLCRRNAVA